MNFQNHPLYVYLAAILTIHVAVVSCQSCQCNKQVGTFCGSRNDNGWLQGKCEWQTLYFCKDANQKVPQILSECDTCVGSTVGKDRCKPKPEEEPCSCGDKTGTYCGSRTSNGWLKGNCIRNGLYKCKKANDNKPEILSECETCIGGKQGYDRCKPKPDEVPCSCENNTGTYCGSRTSNGWLKGSCVKNELYFCRKFNDNKPDMLAECKACVGSKQGYDRCKNKRD